MTMKFTGISGSAPSPATLPVALMSTLHSRFASGAAVPSPVTLREPL